MCASACTLPGLFALQVRAIAEATVELRSEGLDPQPEIMVPLVGSARELQLVREEAEGVLAEVARGSGTPLDFPIGCMIELPRAALTAHRIAEEADFFSFGTNDLTQTTWGFSRDDVEGAFFATTCENGVLTISPFETLDADGVGALVEAGVAGGRTLDEAGPAPRGLRRARRRPRVDPLLPRRGPGLRVLLAVPGAGRPAGGGPGDGDSQGLSVSRSGVVRDGTVLAYGVSEPFGPGLPRK